MIHKGGMVDIWGRSTDKRGATVEEEGSGSCSPIELGGGWTPLAYYTRTLHHRVSEVNLCFETMQSVIYICL